LEDVDDVGKKTYEVEQAAMACLEGDDADDDTISVCRKRINFVAFTTEVTKVRVGFTVSAFLLVRTREPLNGLS
jgi:hypothetical protein